MTAPEYKPALYLLDDELDGPSVNGQAANRSGQFRSIRVAADPHLAYEWLLEAAGEPRGLPDLIVIDWKMSGMNGWALACALSLHKTLSFIPVVALSNSSELRDRQQALELGCAAFYQRPKSLESLVKLFRHLRLNYCGTEVQTAFGKAREKDLRSFSAKSKFFETANA